MRTVAGVGRGAVEQEMKECAGTVLGALDRVPDELVDAEWRRLRHWLFDETLIPSRYKALLGVAVAASLRCPYSTRLQSELARVHGASEAELAEAVEHAALVAGWSTRLSGLEVSPADFAVEVERVIGHVATRLGLQP
jgi:alkylhydroperoxidase/carboxymuconolactone decarboxylase family protein YurZ